MGRLATPGRAPREAGVDDRAAAALVLGLGYSLHFLVVTFVGWPGQSSSLFEDLVYDDLLGVFSVARNASFCLAFFMCFALAQ